MAVGNKTLDDLLRPISQQMGHTQVADHVDIPDWGAAPMRVTDGMSHAELVDKFIEEAEKVGVGARRCERRHLVQTIAEVVGAGYPETGEVCGVVCANDERFAQAGLYDALGENEKVSRLTIWNGERGQESFDAAEAATYGVTYATAGIAESATIVQPTTPLCGRSVSLLPLVHVAVVDAATIVPTMLEVMKDYAQQGGKLPSQVCLISGPSATADIELVRVQGVHGPMYVHYVVVDD